MIETRRPSTARSGRVRAARLTDLAAVGELSRLSHSDERSDARMRTLGLPVGSGHISVFSMFRLPLAAFMPNDLLYVYDDRGHVVGLARVEHERLRDEWTIVELDAMDVDGRAGDIRYRLVQHLLRDASKRGGIRFHVACSDDGGNVDLFMQAGFARYGEERILYRPPQDPPQRPVSTAEATELGIRPAMPLDALELDRLYRAATPAPVARLEDYRLHDWERQGSHWRVPRSSLTPLLRFADVEGFVAQDMHGPSQQLSAFLQVGVAKDEQPHYLRVVALPDYDASDLIAFGVAYVTTRQADQRGVVSAVRTYEAPLDRRLEEAGFTGLAQVSLLMKEVAQRVTEPALVPVASR